MNTPPPCRSWPGPLFSLERLHQSLTSKKHEVIVREPLETPLRVRTALERYFPEFQSDSWDLRWAYGGVYVNGLLRGLEELLPSPFRLEYLEPCYDPQFPESYYPTFSKDWIIYEDEDLIACYKPAGLSGMPNREQHEWNLKSFLEKHYGHPLHFPSRLDTSTAGLVLLSRSLRMHNELQQQFERRTIHKKYLCELEHATPPQELFTQLSIGRDPLHPVLRRPEGSGAKKAETLFRMLAKHADSVLYSAEPRSGRTHQIRVHACAGLAALKGDNFYGGPFAEQLHLLSFEVSLEHFFQKKEIRLSLPSCFWPDWLLRWEKQGVDFLSTMR